MDGYIVFYRILLPLSGVPINHMPAGTRQESSLRRAGESAY